MRVTVTCFMWKESWPQIHIPKQMSKLRSRFSSAAESTMGSMRWRLCNKRFVFTELDNFGGMSMSRTWVCNSPKNESLTKSCLLNLIEECRSNNCRYYSFFLFSKRGLADVLTAIVRDGHSAWQATFSWATLRVWLVHSHIRLSFFHVVITSASSPPASPSSKCTGRLIFPSWHVMDSRRVACCTLMFSLSFRTKSHIKVLFSQQNREALSSPTS